MPELEKTSPLIDIACVKNTIHQVAGDTTVIPQDVEHYEINPTLELVHLTPPQHEETWIKVWRNPHTDSVEVEEANEEELLLLKIIVEEIDPSQIAAWGKISINAIEHAMSHGAQRGFLIAPRSRIRRDDIEVDVFTLQWHITHACDLNCKHCYDRSKRSTLTLNQARGVLEDFNRFCKAKHVRGHVCFSGGNPFLHPNFFEIYAAAAENRFSTSILGNPVPRRQLEQIMAIQPPGYFQVSLEGLKLHNDEMRGAGFYDRVIDFLHLLREVQISSTVMLTLTSDNIDQALPLAEQLRKHTDHFTFNRLSPVGSGSRLSLPPPEKYRRFVENWVDASHKNTVIGFKDNLINIELQKRGMKTFDGCTGYGCGAAFNFIAVLPDGEAHACRKFPSPIGNILEQNIGQVYDSEIAERYRRRPAACAECNLSQKCGGCFAMVHGSGMDIHKDRDPYCFID